MLVTICRVSLSSAHSPANKLAEVAAHCLQCGKRLGLGWAHWCCPIGEPRSRRSCQKQPTYSQLAPCLRSHEVIHFGLSKTLRAECWAWRGGAWVLPKSLPATRLASGTLIGTRPLGNAVGCCFADKSLSLELNNTNKYCTVHAKCLLTF